jgi:hypothetical protein
MRPPWLLAAKSRSSRTPRAPVERNGKAKSRLLESCGNPEPTGSNEAPRTGTPVGGPMQSLSRLGKPRGRSLFVAPSPWTHREDLHRRRNSTLARSRRSTTWARQGQDVVCRQPPSAAMPGSTPRGSFQRLNGSLMVLDEVGFDGADMEMRRLSSQEGRWWTQGRRSITCR